MSARGLMVLGTSSHCGKSLLAAGLCRALHRAGIRVAPFKAQNMSNNAAVTDEGGEIGRAQALQARACGLAPRHMMNPVLLKPTGQRTSQVVVNGRVAGVTSARDYHALARSLRHEATAAYDRLAAEFDVIVLEGAGSCAELNLDWDFVNLAMARHARADALLVGDIDRGGIFAQLIGTLSLLAPEDRALVRATIINKFRGDLELLDTARTIIESRTGIPLAGVLPYLDGLLLDEEDSLGIPSAIPPAPPICAIHGAGGTAWPPAAAPPGVAAIEIAVLRLPSISNFTDLTVLLREPDVRLRFVDPRRGDPIETADVVILPGSKNTIADLMLLRETGYDARLSARAEAGAEIVGLCGGMQMLGTMLCDAQGIEHRGETPGLGLLRIRTTWAPEKMLAIVRGRHNTLESGFVGYEIHCGRTESEGEAALLETEDGRPIGWGRERIWGTYVHGLFDEPELRHAWLRRLRLRKGLLPEIARTPYSVERELDRLADAIAEALTLPGEWNEWIRQ
jgi:adenosylcobyric acid synthase